MRRSSRKPHAFPKRSFWKKRPRSSCDDSPDNLSGNLREPLFKISKTLFKTAQNLCQNTAFLLKSNQIICAPSGAYIDFLRMPVSAKILPQSVLRSGPPYKPLTPRASAPAVPTYKHNQRRARDHNVQTNQHRSRDHNVQTNQRRSKNHNAQTQPSQRKRPQRANQPTPHKEPQRANQPTPQKRKEPHHANV